MTSNDRFDSPEQLQREVDEQRSSIDQIVDALEKKMSPGQWVDQTLAYVRDNGGEFAGNLGSSVRRNPLPAVLMSVSLAWLMLGQQRSGATTPPSGDGTSGGLDGLKDKLQDTASTLKDKAGRLGDLKLGEQGQRLQLGLSSLVHQQPLVLAGVALALGAAIGQNLPPVERQWSRPAQGHSAPGSVPSASGTAPSTSGTAPSTSGTTL